jgi:hypothetical protein
MSEIKTGKIRFLSADRGGGRLLLEDYDHEFIIELTQQNYNAMFSIATAAAINRYEIRISAGDLTRVDTDVEVHYADEISVFWPY